MAQIMAALRSRCGHYIFALWFILLLLFLPLLRLLSIFFPRLISAVADWMSAILPHMVWPQCEFKMHVWNMLHAARWNSGRKNSAKNRGLGTNAQFCPAISSQLKACINNWKKLVKQQYLLHMSPQYGELRPTNGCTCIFNRKRKLK